MHYLDNVATTQVKDSCVRIAADMMTQTFGNPSSLHAMGIAAERALSKARSQVAAAIGADARRIIFTSCGTESDNTAVFCTAKRFVKRGKHIITTAAEHPAVRNPVQALENEGFSVTVLPTDQNGLIRMADLEAALRPDTILVSVMLVNNETGAIMPVSQIKKLLTRKKSQALLHTDAVQALGKLPINVNTLGVDLMSLSGHKIHAPKGIGALYIRQGLTLPPYLHGGGQESGLRSGTESLPLIAAFGEACRMIAEDLPAMRRQASELKTYLLERLTAEVPAAVVNFPNDASHIPNIASISLPGAKSEVMMRILEGHEVYVSSGSACSKGKKSAVLTACGLPDDVIDGTIRVSFTDTNTKEDIDALIEGLKECDKRLLGVKEIL